MNEQFNQQIKKHSPARHVKSAQYAFEGLFHALLNEPNFRVEVVISAIVVTMGLFFDISNTEWGLIVISLGFLLTAEMVNTTVEAFVDHLIQERTQSAKIIKDLAAGSVLTAATSTFIIILLVFAEDLLRLFNLL